MKLVLTGGPSGGKTTLAMALQREFANKLVVVPESASMLYAGGFPRKNEIKSIQHRQRAIYFVQRELEAMFQDDFPNHLLVCDRGSLDALAYWQGNPDEFFTSVETTHDREIKRYDWVLHLDTAPESYYDLTNPLRVETYEEASRLNEKTKAAWNNHPQRIVITSEGHFLDKLHRSLFVIDCILNGNAYSEVIEKLKKFTSAGTGK